MKQIIITTDKSRTQIYVDDKFAFQTLTAPLYLAEYLTKLLGLLQVKDVEIRIRK